nr:MAG TPA: hypothetical protein [Caudoviricetes sp.]
MHYCGIINPLELAVFLHFPCIFWEATRRLSYGLSSQPASIVI